MKLDITAEFVRAHFHYDESTGLLTRLIATSNSVTVGDVAGCLGRDGYVAVKVNGTAYKAHRLAWLWMTGKWPENQVDHINFVKSDNRWSNLREATNSQNASNRPMRKQRGFKGVFWHSRKRKWQASICINYRQIYIGQFESEDDARAAYMQKATELHKEFARTE